MTEIERRLKRAEENEKDRQSARNVTTSTQTRQSAASSSSGRSDTERRLRIAEEQSRQAAKSSTWWEDYKRSKRYEIANRQLEKNRSRDAAEDEIRELFRNPFSSDAKWQAGVLQRNAERYKRDLSLYQEAMKNASTSGEYFGAHRQAVEAQSAVKHQFERYQQAAQKAEQDRNESNLVNRPALYASEHMTPEQISAELDRLRSGAATPTVTDKDRNDPVYAYMYPDAVLRKVPHGVRFDERLLEGAGQDAIDALYRPILTEQEKAAVEEADRKIIEDKANRNYERVQILKAAQSMQTERTSRETGNQLMEEIATGGAAAKQVETGRAAFEAKQQQIASETSFEIGDDLDSNRGAYNKMQKERRERGYIMGYDWDNVPEARKQAVYALYAQDPEKAMELAKYYIADARQAEDEERQAWYAQSGWTAALGLVSSAAAHLGAAVDPFGDVGQELTRRGDNALAGGSQWADAATGYQKIPEWVPIVGGKGAGDLYQTVGSVVQSAAVAAPAILVGRYDKAAAEIIGNLGLVLMGSSAAASDYRESVAAGMDEDRAKLHALAAGVEEALFEKVSLDKLIKMDTSGGLKSALKNWLVQSGIEGSEELATSIANRFTDELISGAGQSKVERRASELIANGMNSTEAHTQAESEWMKDTLYEGFSGFLSGGMMTGGDYALQGLANLKGRAVNAAETRKAQKQAGAVVSRSEGSVEALQAYAKDNGIEIKAVETAEQNAEENAEQGSQEAKQNSYSARDYRSISDTNSKVVQSIRSEVRGKTAQEQQAVRDSLVEKYGEGIAPAVYNAISLETASRVRQEYGDVDSIQAARNQAISEIKDESLRRAVSDGYDSAAYSLAASQGGEGGMNTMSRYIQQRRNTGSGSEMSMNATVTTQDGSTKAIAITGMSEDGKRVSLANGSEVAVKDLQADADTTSAIQQLADLDLGADATKVLQAYQQSGVAGTEGYRWLMDYATAYNQGRTRQISLEQAAQRSSLDERTVMDAYTLGQQAANRETQAGLEKLKNLPKRKGANGKTANIDTTEIKGKTMSKSELEQFELANQYAQALGVDMTWFSSKEKDGKFVGKNGAYENGKIYMDIHAGRNFAADLTSGILATMGHELSHFEQQYAPEEYQALKEFLFEQIVKSSPNGEARLERLIWEKQRRSGNTLSRKAAEDEVVADACQKMLRDSKAVRDFASQQPEAANGVIRWLDKWFKKVRSIFGRGGNYSEEAQIMDSLEQDVKAAFGELWDKALKQAAKVHDEVGNIGASAIRSIEETGASEQMAEEAVVQNSDRLDDETLRFLDNQEHVTVYRAMQMIDGKLYPPMAAKVEGKLVDATELGEWYQAVERPDLIDPKTGKWKLDKANGKAIKAAYNPYFHTSATPLNDQFSSAYKRPNIVVVEGIIPKSELTSGYKAQYAKNSVGETKWHAGPVASKLKGAKSRRVFLSRWFQAQRVVSDAEVADVVAKTLEGENIAVPNNVVTPSLLEALRERGVAIDEEAIDRFESKHGMRQNSDRDTEYLELAKNPEKNAARLQEMVDEAAELAGYTIKAYHGTGGEFNSFDLQRSGSNSKELVGESAEGMFFFSSIREAYPGSAQDYARIAGKKTGQEVIRDVYLKMENPLELDSKGWYATADYYDNNRDSIYDQYLSGDYDGIIIRDSSGGDDNTIYLLDDANRIKSADPVTYDDNGNVIPLSERFNKANEDIRYSERDYMKAVESGDIETAQRMVDEAAKKAGYTIKAYHAGAKNITAFQSGNSAGLIYFADTEKAAKQAARSSKQVYTVYLKADNPVNSKNTPVNWYDAEDSLKVAKWKREGYDAVYVKDEAGVSIAVFAPDQIKSADPVTYDDDGNAIPLSERFNKANEDIRYSSRPTTDSTGRELSEGQQEYFKDSKILDKYGNLLTLYHGTASDFTVFDLGRSGKNYDGWSEYGIGIYLTPDKKFATYFSESASQRGGTPRLMELYANIKNPFNVNDPVTVDVSEYAKKYKLTEDDVKFLKKSGDRWLAFMREHNEDIYDFLTSHGYDGLWDAYGTHAPTQIVAFTENQVKNVDNHNPTDNPDIRYSERDNAKPRSAQAQRDAGYKLSESKFYSLYSAHKLNMIGKGNVQEQISSIMADGFKGDGGFGNNVMPTNISYDVDENGKRIPRGLSAQKYAPKKGEYILLVPKEGVEVKGGRYNFTERVKPGYKPAFDYEIVQADYDGQPYYEMYEKAYDKSQAEKADVTLDGAQFSERDYSAPSDEELLDAVQSTELNDTEQKRLLTEYQTLRRQIKSMEKRLETLEENRAKLNEKIQGGKEYSEKYVSIKDKEIENLRREIETSREYLQEKMLTPKLADLLKAQRRNAAAKAKQQKEAQFARYKEGKKAGELRRRITRHSKELYGKLTKPSDKRHIPESYRGAVAALLNTINLESAYDIQEGTKNESGRGGKHVEKGTGTATNRTKAFQEVRKQLEKVLAEGGFTGELINNAAEGFDGGLIEKCQDFADKPISTLSSEELETLWNTIRALEHNITTFNKAFALAKTETISGIADSFLASAQKRKPLLKDPKSRLDLKIKKTSGAAMKALENPYTFFSHYGEEGIKLYRALRDTQDLEIVRTNNLSDLWVRKMADILGDEKTAKLNGDELTNAILDKIRDTSKQMDEKVETFKLENGQTITLTHAMLMDVYLLAQRGEVGMNHLLGSGLIQPEIRAKGKYVARDPSFRKLSLQDVQKLTGVITENATEKAIADAIQSMQHQLADWGNKASMDVFGYRKFTEDNYWPVKNAKEENKSDSGKGGNQPANVMNKGMAKNLVPHAATGMEPMSAFTKLQGSISDMLMYATWGPVMEDFKRFYNWKWLNPNGGTSDTVKGVMERYGGEGSQRYWEELRDQINNGIGNGKNIVDQFIGKAVGAVKGARVAYNLRVVVQQPTAYARAAEVISGKYLAASLLDIKSWGWKAKSAWNRALTHSPIAMRKDSTIYDMGGNISAGGEFGLDRPGYLDKARDFGTALAGKADAITWGRLWHAAELQISAKTNLEHGSQEYWDAVNKLFTEAVDRTQVVDGLLQRPAIMRTDSDFVKGATSYMGEPLMQLNMLMRQVNDFRQTGFKATKKQIGKTVTALVVTQLFNAMLTGLYDAGIRKDDEDKDFWERFVAEITGLDGTEENAWDYITSVWLESNATSEMSVMQKIPLVKDVLSMLQGYDPSNNRMDLDAIKDLIDVCTKVLWNDNYTPLYKAKEMINKASMIFGAGFGNALKDMYGFTRNIINDFGKPQARFDFKALWLNLASKKNKSQYFDILAQMAENGDKDAFRQRVKLVRDDGMSNEKFFEYVHEGMTDAFRKRYFNHKLKDDQAVTLLMQYSGKDEKDAWNTVRKWKDQAKHVGADGKLPDGYKWNQYDELKAEVATGNDISELIQTYKANGYSETQINGAIRDSIQEALTAGDLDEKEAADALIQYGVTYSKDGKTVVYDKQSAWKKVQEWIDKAEHTDEDGEIEDGYKYSAYADLFDAVDTNKNADGIIQTMVQNGGYDTDSLRGKIKEHLLERFIAGQITETALKNQLSRYCKISKADDANEIVANAKCKRDFGVYPDDLKEAFKDGDLSQNQAEKALQQYKGLSKADAQNRVQYWGYDGDLSENAWLKWNKDLKSSGLSVENWEKVYKVKSSAKGTDANGDGRADSGTVKAEVVSYIDSMNIPKSQKKAIYLAFGWAASTMPSWR